MHKIVCINALETVQIQKILVPTFYRILDWADTVNEADDVVEYIKKEETSAYHVELVPYSAIRLFVWDIRDNQNNKLKMISSEEPKQSSSTPNEKNKMEKKRETLYFATYDNAVEFLKWLKASHKKPITQVAGIEIELPNGGVEASRVGFDELPARQHPSKKPCESDSQDFQTQKK